MFLVFEELSKLWGGVERYIPLLGGLIISFESLNLLNAVFFFISLSFWWNRSKKSDVKYWVVYIFLINMIIITRYFGSQYFDQRSFNLEIVEMLGLFVPEHGWNKFYIAVLFLTAWSSGTYYHHVCYQQSSEFKYLTRFRQVVLENSSNKTYRHLKKCYFYCTIWFNSYMIWIFHASFPVILINLGVTP